MPSLKAILGIVTPCGNRQRFPYGGNHEHRIYRSPTSDQTSTGRSLSRGDLSAVGSSVRLVPCVVATLSSVRPQWVVRSDARQCATASDCPRSRANDHQHSTATRVASVSGHALQPHGGQYDFSRIAELAPSTGAQPTHDRARPAAQWHQSAQSPLGAFPCQPDLPSATRRRVQSTPSGGQRRSALLERPSAALLHFRGQGCLRWRRVPENLSVPQDGSPPRLPGRVLEDAGPAGSSPIRQCPRRRGGGRPPPPLSPPGAARLLALRRRGRADPAGSTSTPRQRRTLQWLVPTALTATPLHAPRHAEARSATLAGHGQYAAPPATLAWFDPGRLPPALQVAEAARRICDPHRTLAHCGRTDQLHSASHAQWQGAFAQSDLQSGQASER